MNTDPLFLLKHEGGVAVPGRITTPTNAEKEIRVLFDRDFAESNFGGASTENARPVASVQSEAVAGLLITNSDNSTGATTLDIDDLWEDDDGNPVTNEDDEAVYASNVFEMKVRSKFNDGTGIVQLELTMNN